MPNAPTPIRIAVIDLYNDTPNEGLRAIRELLLAADRKHFGVPVSFDFFETRFKGEAPGLDYDLYLSSGGPGSPFDGEGMPWEATYFRLLEALWSHNQHPGRDKKHVLYICHSYQMMCRFFEVAEVVKRRGPSFGILPVHKTPAGKAEPLFAGLGDPFFAADFRQWQVLQPNLPRLAELGGDVLALEKKRGHIPLERATMAIRLSPEMIGVQFHPEADPPGMLRHFRQPERRKYVIELHGEEKYERILHRLEDPKFLTRTHDFFVPTFIRLAIEAVRPAQVKAYEMATSVSA